MPRLDWTELMVQTYTVFSDRILQVLYKTDISFHQSEWVLVVCLLNLDIMEKPIVTDRSNWSEFWRAINCAFSVIFYWTSPCAMRKTFILLFILSTVSMCIAQTELQMHQCESLARISCRESKFQQFHSPTLGYATWTSFRKWLRLAKHLEAVWNFGAGHWFGNHIQFGQNRI